jgi:hypothetical protein
MGTTAWGVEAKQAEAIGKLRRLEPIARAGHIKSVIRPTNKKTASREARRFCRETT